MKIKSIFIFTILALLCSCIKDHSTEPDKAISEITIVEGSILPRYDIEKNSELIIEPKIIQSDKQKQLSYAWEIDDKVYSTDAKLVYAAESLGSYLCRLVVSNEDGKAFFPFRLNVNSIYEEGITIISKDPDGNSMLTFMLANPDGSDTGKFTDYDCFSRENADEHFASNVSDMTQCSGSLIVACQGGNDDAATIYYLNEKTFIVENMLTAREYPDFKPVKLQIPSVGHIGSFPIMSADGKIYEFSTTEATLMPSTRFISTYSTICTKYDVGISGEYSLLFWDDEVGGLCQTNGGWPRNYICYAGEEYLLRRDSIEADPAYNYFNGRQLIGMFVPRMSQNLQGESPVVVVITRNGSVYQKTFLNKDFWISTDFGNRIGDNGGTTSCGLSKPKFTGDCPHIGVANVTYRSLLFAVDNKIYRWNYTTSNTLASAPEVASVGNGNAIVTSMEVSQDLTRTYIAWYDPAETGLNGHLTVMDTETNDIITTYDNICYRPVKVMYKKK